MPLTMKSNRKRRQQTLPNDEPEMDISSLIDVSFLLLIYFLVTTTLTKKEQDLSVEMASERLETFDTPITPLLIRLEAKGLVFLGERGPLEELVGEDDSIRSLPKLEERLDLYQSAASGSGLLPLIQISVGEEVGYQRVLDVLNSLAGRGIKGVTFTDFKD